MSSLAVGSPDPGFGVSTQFSTLVDLLEWRARFQSARVAYTFLADNGAGRISLNWSQLHRKAQLIGQRLNFMVEDSGASVVLTPESIQEFVSREDSEEALPTQVDLGNLAYVIYTSGSTGRPKGVAVSHGALLNLVSWHNSAFNISASDRATLLAGVSFDASVWELWPYMSCGASLDLPPDDLRSSPEGLRDWITRRAVTVSFVPTPVAEPMLALEWSNETKLRTLLTGGDRLHTWPVSSLPFTVVNNYGPTENAVVSASGLIGSEGGPAGTAPHSADRSVMSAFTSWTSAANPCRSASPESFGSVEIVRRDAISNGPGSPLKCLCPTR